MKNLDTPIVPVMDQKGHVRTASDFERLQRTGELVLLGMTKREEIAARLLASMVNDNRWTKNAAVTRALEWADALLEITDH